MGFDLQGGVKHWSVRGLSQAIHVLQKLPLESVIQSSDPFRIANAVHTILDMTVAHVVPFCMAEPTATTAGFSRSQASLNKVLSSDAAPGSGEEWARPADFMQTDVGHVRECVARFVFAHLHSRLFPRNPTDADVLTANRISRLEWLEPRHLDVPTALAETPQAERAARALQQLHTLRSPVQMLAELAHAFRLVAEAACLRARLGTAGAGEGEAFGADDSLPLFILVVLRANPKMFSSVLAYAECFTARAQMLTEQGYALTQARAAVTFAESVRPEHLAGLRPGEWELHTSGCGR